MNFEQLNLKKELIKAVIKNGYTEPTKIQAEAIPAVLDKKDVIGKSYTGTGKTAAFVLPLLNQLNLELKRVQVLILCPTRELALQVLDQIRKFSLYMNGASSALLCGGSNIQNQIYALKRANIVVGTPGRVVDHLKRRTLKLQALQTIVLDEADEMLKMGFKKDIDFIFSNIVNDYQTVLFSATMPKGVLEIANAYQKDPILISIEQQVQHQNNITQYYVETFGCKKEDVLIKILEETKPELSIIFANTKSFTEHLSKKLFDKGIKSAVINGDKTQSARMQAMKLFRNRSVSLLIATDVAARGIDVDGIDYVYNFDLPLEKEIYTHRIGRTARAGTQGTAISIVNSQKEFMSIRELERYQNKKIIPYKVDLSDLPKELRTRSNSDRKRNFSKQAKNFSSHRSNKFNNKFDKKRVNSYS